MATLFLIIIYLAFISLGLPDSVLGSVWPAMYRDCGAPFSGAGVISMVLSFGTVISSLLSGRMLRRFGTGRVAAVSVLLTAAALLGFSVSHSFVWLLVCAVPLGLGAGSIDAGLNDYVAVHFQASHMNWLHGCWGVGATLGPVIASACMDWGYSWRRGYLVISIIQFCLAVVVLLSLPLWDKVAKESGASAPVEEISPKAGKRNLLALPGLPYVLAAFVLYIAMECVTGVWGGSFLVEVKGLETAEAARMVSLFYAGITIGRFLSGFIALRIQDKLIIRIGEGICLAGVLLMLLPLPSVFFAAALLLLGLGCAPIFPAMLHLTPERFGKEKSRDIMGFQMAFSYLGSTFAPPLFGLLASRTSMMLYPGFLAAAAALLALTTALTDRKIKPAANGQR